MILELVGISFDDSTLRLVSSSCLEPGLEIVSLIITLDVGL